MMRDWFYRGLDARVQIEMKVHYDNCRPLAQSAIYQHIQCAFGDDVQNGVNGLGTKLGYSVIRETMTKLVPEMKNFLHRATAASVSEVQALENDKIGTLEFLEKVHHTLRLLFVWLFMYAPYWSHTAMLDL